MGLLRNALAIVLIVSALGCATAPHSRLTSGRWRITEIDGAATIPERPPWISFGEDGQVIGGAACNNFSGPFERDGGEIRFSDDLITTLVSCRIPGIDMERYYAEGRHLFEVLHAGPLSMHMSGRALMLTTGDEGRSLRLERAE